MDLKQVVETNKTASKVLKDLAERQRYRRETNLDLYERQLAKKESEFSDEEFMETFKSLEKLGYGSIVYGRLGNPNRFIWNYNLKQVAKKAMGEETTPETLAPKKSRRGRPKGSKNKVASRPSSNIDKITTDRVAMSTALKLLEQNIAILKKLVS